MSISTRSGLRLRQLTLTALFAALLCVICPISIPVWAIPITFSLIAVYLTGGILGPVWGLAAVFVYLLLGAVGLPVFSGFSGGIGKLIGITGGYLIGYLPCVAIVGFSRRYPYLFPVLSVAGLAVCYLFGTVWFSISSGNTFVASLSVAVVPYLPFDAIKIVAASLLFYPLRAALSRFTPMQ